MHLVILCALLSACVAWKIPDYFPKCCIANIFVSDCLVRSAIRIKPFIRNGVQDIGIPSLHPLVLEIDEPDQYVHDSGSHQRIVIYGMHNYGIDHLEFYPQEILLKGKLTFKDVTFQTYCNVPSQKNGNKLLQLNTTFLIRGSLKEKYGENYVNIEDVHIKTHSLQDLNNDNCCKEQINSVCGTTTIDEIFKNNLERYLNWFLGVIPFSKIFPCSK
ncbi:hypothetical protein FQR65_LT02606 [Abscondita terminalis]|nr:hypothetical protein FQR65_LT02606 [Abscondita terminalis]